MGAGIPIEELDEETQKKIGAVIPPSLSEIGGNLAALGKVFNSLKGLSDDDALRVLRQTQMYIIARKTAPAIESIALPNDGLGDDYAPPIDWTLQVVARVFKLKPDDLKQRSREDYIVEARQVAMYVLYMTGKYTLDAIGQGIGGRSPATVSHAFGRISDKMTHGPEFKQKVKDIQEMIAGK